MPTQLRSMQAELTPMDPQALEATHAAGMEIAAAVIAQVGLV